MYATSASTYTLAKTSTNSSTSLMASSTMRPGSGRTYVFLRLVEEAAALEQLRALLGGDLDVARRQQEDLVGDALHAAVEGVREPAREVDQALRELGVGALQVEDHRDLLLELVGDLLRVVEAARQYEVHADAVRVRHRFDLRPRRAGGRPDGRAADGRLVGLGVRPVVEVLAAAARREPTYVRALAV